MSAASWERVKELFAGARPLPPAEREAYLARACADDGALADEVRALLGTEADVPAFLDTTAEEALGSFARAEPDLREPGQKVGPWVLEQRVGAGGMGTVWRCHRDGEPKVPYAIKFMRRGLDTALLLNRFAIERRTLAALDHPNVAALVDAGVDLNDRPFLVMEFVDGEPLDRWCDRRRLGVRARVDLFRQVCAAVHHAHRSLVIHRDLKPANVLVTEAGVPKLLDFGVAKMLGEGAGSDTETAVHARMLTPRYASPEQLRGGHVGTASDVYSLGVILYELLAGRTPFPQREGTLQEARNDAEAVPPRPSQVLDDAAAEQRGARLEGLRRQLRGDLDVIALAALRPEPLRRYASAGHLAEDLERHFAGLPVKARGESIPYLSAKWARRHKGLLAMMLLAAGSLAGGIVGVARQASIAREEADTARAEFESRERVVDLLMGLFESAAADSVNPAQISALDLVEGGAAMLEESWQGDEKVRAKLMATLGRVFVHLGRPDRAEALLERSLDLRIALYGERHRDVAESLAALGELRRVQGRPPEAEELLRRAIELQSADAAGDAPGLTWAANSLGLTLMERGEYEEAETWLSRARTAREREYGRSHPGTLVVQGNLAAIRFRQQRYEEAETLLREILDVQDKRPPDLHLGATLNNLGLVLLRLQRGAEAEEAFGRALEIRKALMLPAHPDLVATFQNLAVALYERGVRTSDPEAFRAAAPAFREAATRSGQRLGRAHPEVAALRLNEARSLLLGQETTQAMEVLNATLQEAGPQLPQDHPVILGLLMTTGAAQMDLRLGARAAATYEDLERRIAAMSAPDPWQLARVRVELGAARLMDRDPARSEAVVGRALEVIRTEPEREPELLERAEKVLAEARRRTGRSD